MVGLGWAELGPGLAGRRRIYQPSHSLCTGELHSISVEQYYLDGPLKFAQHRGRRLFYSRLCVPCRIPPVSYSYCGFSMENRRRRLQSGNARA